MKATLLGRSQDHHHQARGEEGQDNQDHRAAPQHQGPGCDEVIVSTWKSKYFWKTDVFVQENLMETEAM